MTENQREARCLVCGFMAYRFGAGPAYQHIEGPPEPVDHDPVTENQETRPGSIGAPMADPNGERGPVTERDDWPFDDEFGLCMDPCEHPSINGGICAACGETRHTERVTLSFDIEQEHLDALSDFKGAYQGITVGEVAAWLCKRHDARDGYIHFTVGQNGGTGRAAQ